MCLAEVKLSFQLDFLKLSKYCVLLYFFCTYRDHIFLYFNISGPSQIITISRSGVEGREGGKPSACQYRKVDIYCVQQ